MPAMVQAHPELPEPRPNDTVIITSFDRHLHAHAKSENTRNCYRLALRLLARWAAGAGAPELVELAQADIENWLIWMQDTARTRRGGPYSDGYVNNQFRSVAPFFTWLVEEGEIPANPMQKMKPPATKTKVVAILTNEQIAALLAQVDRKRDFDSRRDLAIMRLFLCSGVRLKELTDLTTESLNLIHASARVVGKGNIERTVRFDAKTVAALDRYERARAGHKQAKLTNALWLGTNHRRPLTRNGIRQMITRRAAAIGVRIHPHMFRHNFSHRWLDGGGAEGDLMELNGWRSPAMLRHYGASARAARASRAYDRVDIMGGM